jgi:transketolase
MSDFAKASPQRFFEIGVAEQNMAGIAAGMALAGKIPFMASYAAFSPGRNFDQIRVSIAYSQNNVKVIGAHGGISVGPDGATHQMLEDVAMMRALPNMVVLVPADYDQAYLATLAAANHIGPVYIRLSREKTAKVTTSKTPFKIGQANLYREGKDITIIANGTLVYEALLAAEELGQKGIEAEVIDCYSVKPLDEYTILKSAAKTRAVVTAEEAQVNGGLGGAIAELLSENLPTPLQRIGVLDRFGESGQANELMHSFGLTKKDIMNACVNVLERKNNA